MGRWERKGSMVIFRVDFPFVCSAAQERHRRGSPFRLRWPRPEMDPQKVR